MVTIQLPRVKVELYLWCQVLFSSLLLIVSTDVFSSGQLIMRTSVWNENINAVSQSFCNQKIKNAGCNISKVDGLGGRLLSSSNSRNTWKGFAVNLFTSVYNQIYLFFMTMGKNDKERKRIENLYNLKLQLEELRKIMTENPEWVLILVWDIDGTIYYHSSEDDEDLSAELTTVFQELRESEQLLLIYNTGRDKSFNDFSFKRWSKPIPKPDIIIADEGSYYLFNKFANNPLFNGDKLVFDNSENDKYFYMEHHELLSINGCEVAFSPHSLKNECQPSENASDEESDTSDTNIKKVVRIMKSITQSESKYDYWHQRYERYEDNTSIIFLYHRHYNKGASFSRLMNWLSNEHSSFKGKIKIISSAGDSLHDTAMMHPDMHFSFDESYQETELTPRLPPNTIFAGAVLSKGGELQKKRFKPLFEGLETVNSKMESILGIVEGTVTLLLKQIPVVGSGSWFW